jgi:hypothetical protein
MRGRVQIEVKPIAIASTDKTRIEIEGLERCRREHRAGRRMTGIQQRKH